jgi:cytochrome P450
MYGSTIAGKVTVMPERNPYTTIQTMIPASDLVAIHENATIPAATSAPRISGWIEGLEHEGLVRYPGIGGSECVIPLNSDAVKEVLVTKAYSCFERPRLSRARFRALIGNGLLSVDDEEHKLHRRKLLPAFAFRHIRDLYPVF